MPIISTYYALIRVKEKKYNIEYTNQFSVPASTIKGLHQRGAINTSKRGISDFTTNNKYSQYCYMKYYYMTTVFYELKGIESWLKATKGSCDRNLIVNILETEALSPKERVVLYEKVDIYFSLQKHLDLINVIYLNESRLFLKNAHTTVKYLSKEISYHLNAKSTIKEIISLNLIPSSLDVLLLEDSYLYFIIYFYRIVQQKLPL